MDQPVDLRRRRVILSSAVAAAGLGTLSPAALAQAAKAKPLPKYVEWKYSDSLIIHSGNTIETRRAAFGTSVIVPNDILFVRNNLPPPDEASTVHYPDNWELAVTGVDKPGKISLAELKRLEIETVATVLQCSGNGRGFFKHKASGTQWTVGAAGCSVFSGVPVAAVIKAFGGVAGGMKFMTGTGGEKIAAGLDPKTVIVERSLPLAAAEIAMLAWELNGEPLPLAHGGPLRLVIPGYYGVNNVKYLDRLAFTDKETAASIQSSGYRIRDIGKKGAPGQPTMWEMNVKSWINQPLGEDGPLPAGRVQIHGVAFAGVNPVARVEVSVDGGSTWKDAKFIGPDLGRYAWRQFVLPVNLASGRHALASRATDSAGNTQPVERLENERGYGHNGWRDHGVTVTVA